MSLTMHLSNDVHSKKIKIGINPKNLYPRIKNCMTGKYPHNIHDIVNAHRFHGTAAMRTSVLKLPGLRNQC